MPDASHTKLFARKISDFCRLRIDPAFPPQESAQIRTFLLHLIAGSVTPPRKLRGYDWEEIALQCGLDEKALWNAKATIEAALDAITRNTKPLTGRPAIAAPSRKNPTSVPRRGRPSKQLSKDERSEGSRGVADPSKRKAAMDRQKPGQKPRAIEEFPEPLFQQWIEPTSFPEALELHMRRHGDSYWHLHRAVVRDDENRHHSFDRNGPTPCASLHRWAKRFRLLPWAEPASHRAGERL